MLIRPLILIIVLCTACRMEEFSGIRQSGLRQIKCPEFKGRKLRKNPTAWRALKPKKEDKAALAKMRRDNSIFRTRIEHLQTTTDENFDLKPILRQVNVEDLDCPKPGMGKNLPKAVKQNLRKNHRKIRTYLKKRTEAGSGSTNFPAGSN